MAVTAHPKAASRAGGLAQGNGRLEDNGKVARVLVIDDDPAIRMLCAISLQTERVAVVEAPDGRRGLDQARSEPPDVVVTDVRMPGLDGFELAEALRSDERTRAIPLIFLSAEAEPFNEARAQELGALAYLTKPFDPPALASLVAGAVAPRLTAS
ncbi:MAG: response regulator [Gaiellaceae bacterium]